jgi:hypothetical protein
LVAFKKNACILGIKSHCIQGEIHLLRNIHLEYLLCSAELQVILGLDPCFHSGTVVLEARAISTLTFFIFVFMILQLTMNDFSVHRIIGRGGFGEVYGDRKSVV